MKHTEHFLTKWHDCDPDLIIRPSQVLMYMQECANRQCRAIELDLDEIHQRDGIGFIMSRIQVSIDAPLPPYIRIWVNTWCPPSRSYSFNRCFEIEYDGKVYARASSEWALVNLRERTFIKSEDFPAAALFPADEMIDKSELPRRVRITSSAQLCEVGRREVRYSDLDYNMHMNNTKYPDMLCDYVPNMLGKFVSGFSLSYLHEAAYGDVLTIYRAPSDNGYLFRVINQDGKTCMEAELYLKDMDV